MLNLNGSLTKAGVKYSTLWSEDFSDATFIEKLGHWLKTGKLKHKTDHVVPLEDVKIPKPERQVAKALAEQLLREKAILGVFDEGCMGMFNAIIPDHLLNPLGIFKERLSQSALYYETTQVADDEALAVRRWMEERGMKFITGSSPQSDLTDDQILAQCKMYIASLRIADDFGCHAIGIQYQQGLKDLLPASDLVEGTLNNADRPPVTSRDGSRILYAGEPLPHFNEVDECAGLDGLMTYRVHKALGQPVENTLHDLRWGDWDQSGTVKDYVWVFLISGSAPAMPLCRRLGRRRQQRAAAGDVLSARRRHAQGNLETGRDRLVANLHRERSAEDGPWPRRRCRVASGRNPSPLGSHHAAMAHHARGDIRRLAHDQMMARDTRATTFKLRMRIAPEEADRALVGQGGALAGCGSG